jgi:hypothetical protein
VRRQHFGSAQFACLRKFHRLCGPGVRRARSIVAECNLAVPVLQLGLRKRKRTLTETLSGSDGTRAQRAPKAQKQNCKPRRTGIY